MAANDVVFRVSSQDAGILSQFLKGQQAIRAMEKGVGDVDTALGRADRKVGSTIDKMIQGLPRAAMQFAGIGTALAGIHSTAALLRSEFERYLQLRREAVEPVVSYEAALEEAELSAAGGPGSLAPHRQRIGAAVAKYRGGAVPAIQALQAGLSGGGGDVERAMGAWEAGIDMFGHWAEPETLRQIVGTMLDMQKRTGEKDWQVMAAKIAASWKEVRGTRMRDLAFGLMPQVAQAQSMYPKSDYSELLALGATLSQQMVDPEMHRSSQAFLTLLDEMRTSFASAQFLGDKQQSALLGLNPIDQLREIRGEGKVLSGQQARMMRAYLLGTRSGEADVRRLAGQFGPAGGVLSAERKAEPALRDLLEADAVDHGWKDLLASERNMRTTDFRALADQILASRKTEGGIEDFAGGSKGFQEAITAARVDQAFVGVLLQELDATTKAHGLSGIRSKVEELRTLANAAGASPQQVLQEAINIHGRIMEGAVANASFVDMKRDAGFEAWLQRKYPGLYADGGDPWDLLSKEGNTPRSDLAFAGGRRVPTDRGRQLWARYRLQTGQVDDAKLALEYERIEELRAMDPSLRPPRSIGYQYFRNEADARATQLLEENNAAMRDNNEVLRELVAAIAAPTAAGPLPGGVLPALIEGAWDALNQWGE